MPPDDDTQPLPKKLRQLMGSGDDKGSRDKQLYSKDATQEPAEHVNRSRKRCELLHIY